MQESLEERAARLSIDARGTALLSLLLQHGNIGERIATKVGVSPQVVGRWIERGFISVRGAIALEGVTGKPKEYFRPDVSGDAWENPRGRAFGSVAEDKEPDSALLSELAASHGGTAELCRKAGITLGNYHTWKSRGRIPAIKLPVLLGLRK
jgi:hypothetical protein